MLMDWNTYFNLLSISKRPPPPSSTSRQQPKNEDVTIDVSKVFVHITARTTLIQWIDF